MSELAPTLQAFFLTGLDRQRGASPHTVTLTGMRSGCSSLSPTSTRANTPATSTSPTLTPS